MLADHVYQDVQTGKKVIAGTFNVLFARTFPAQFGRSTFAFISLTEVRGSVELVLRYVRLDTNQVLLMTQPIRVESQDPLQTFELTFEVPPFPMPGPGVYAFEVLSEDVPIGSVRMSVKQIPDGTGLDKEDAT